MCLPSLVLIARDIFLLKRGHTDCGVDRISVWGAYRGSEDAEEGGEHYLVLKWRILMQYISGRLGVSAAASDGTNPTSPIAVVALRLDLISSRRRERTGSITSITSK